jgi:hypothetical protein
VCPLQRLALRVEARRTTTLWRTLPRRPHIPCDLSATLKAIRTCAARITWATARADEPRECSTCSHDCEIGEHFQPLNRPLGIAARSSGRRMMLPIDNAPAPICRKDRPPLLEHKSRVLDSIMRAREIIERSFPREPCPNTFLAEQHHELIPLEQHQYCLGRRENGWGRPKSVLLWGVNGAAFCPRKGARPFATCPSLGRAASFGTSQIRLSRACAMCWNPHSADQPTRGLQTKKLQRPQSV